MKFPNSESKKNGTIRIQSMQKATSVIKKFVSND